MAALERLAGGLAAEQTSPGRLAEISGLHYEMLAHHARGELPGYFRCNQAIHLAIMDATGNAVLTREYATLNARIRRYRYMANLSQQRWDQSVREHEAILWSPARARQPGVRRHARPAPLQQARPPAAAPGRLTRNAQQASPGRVRPGRPGPCP